MENLKKYLYEGNINEVIDNYYPCEITNKDKWLNETFIDYCLKNNLEPSKEIEKEFYNTKFNNDYINTPQYWVYQCGLYENISHSLNTKYDSEIFIKLFGCIEGIDKVENINEYVIKIYYNEDFDMKSKEFKTLLNFSNYFIQTKYEDELPNPFQIEGRKSNIIEYDNNLEYVYHVTNIHCYDKIKKYGLIPRDKTTIVNHTKRLYLFTKYNEMNMLSYGRLSLRLFKLYNINKEKHNLSNKININKDIVILKINIKEFNKDHKSNLILMGDMTNTNKECVYTQEPIPTKYIERIY